MRSGLVLLAFMLLVGLSGSMAATVSAGHAEVPRKPVVRAGEQVDNSKERAEIEPAFSLHVEEIGPDIFVTVSGTSLQDVYAYELRLDHDASRLQLVEFRNVMPGAGIAAEPLVEQSLIRLAYTQIGPVQGQGGQMPLAAIQFRPLVAGATELKLSEVRLVDSNLKLTVHVPDIKASIGLETMAMLDFTDIGGHWAEREIRQALANGIINGYGDGTFRPDRAISRAELSVMIAKALALPDAAAHPFSDKQLIPDWANPYVSAAWSAQVLVGYQDGTFRAARRVTRTEASVMAVQAARLPIVLSTVPEFSDRHAIAGWALPLVAAAESAGLVVGRGGGRFAPQAEVTRSEIVVLINRILKQRASASTSASTSTSTSTSIKF